MKFKNIFLLVLLSSNLLQANLWSDINSSSLVSSSWTKRIGGFAVGAAGAAVCSAGLPLIVALGLGGAVIGHGWNQNNETIAELRAIRGLQKLNIDRLGSQAVQVDGFTRRLRTVDSLLTTSVEIAKNTGIKITKVEQLVTTRGRDHRSNLALINEQVAASSMQAAESKAILAVLLAEQAGQSALMKDFELAKVVKQKEVQALLADRSTEILAIRVQQQQALKEDLKINQQIRALIEPLGSDSSSVKAGLLREALAKDSNAKGLGRARLYSETNSLLALTFAVCRSQKPSVEAGSDGSVMGAVYAVTAAAGLQRLDEDA
jgi:hypothetical protein